MEQYPDNPGVMFLDALTTETAEEAILAYRKLLQYHPASPYADDAAMKIGEYLYARGLYTQASRELAKLPQLYPESEHIQRAADLQVSSLMAIGERDSVDHYLALYGRRFPSLNLQYNLEAEKPLINRPLTESSAPPRSPGVTQPAVESVSSVPRPQAAPPPRPYVIQVGAYGSVENALRQKMLLEQRGFEVELWPISVRGRELQAVQIVRYSSRDEAQKEGEKVKASLGFGFMVLERPEK